MNRIYSALLLLMFWTFVSSCQKAEEQKVSPADLSKGTYFSIKDFTKDQWKTFRGQPYVLQQYTTLNGKTDSVMLSALTLKWSAIFKTFFEADISDPKFLNRYDFTMFEEPTTQTRTFTYTAKEPELYTQKLQIAADIEHNKIRNIFIETKKETFWNTETQKLLYSPVHVLQIQQHNDPLIGRQKELVITYKFQ